MTKKNIFFLACLVLLGMRFLFASKKFKKEALHRIATESIALPEKERLNFIVQELHRVYGTIEKPNFYLFNGGNAHGMLGLLYASMTEYLIIFGTPLSNSGHSGRYLMTVHDFVYRGKVSRVSPCCLEGLSIKPGQISTLPLGAAHHYALDANTWMLEYGHGCTLTALPFIFFGFIATGDIVGTLQLMGAYGKQVIKNLFSF